MLSLVRGLLIFLLCLCSCNEIAKPQDYKVGRDPYWYPLDFGEKTASINGFVNALVMAIAKVENVPFQIVDSDWIELPQGLYNQTYSGILSSITPTIESRDKYTFSDPFLLLGPVLIVPIDSDVTSLENLEEKKVGISAFDDSVFIVQKYPTIVIQAYENMSRALEDLASGKLDGVLLGNLEAHAYVSNIYSSRLKIVTPPLNDKALRLIVLKGEHKSLIKHFNDGLKKLEASGVYEQLRSLFRV